MNNLTNETVNEMSKSVGNVDQNLESDVVPNAASVDFNNLRMPYGVEMELEHRITKRLDMMGIYYHSTSRVKTVESLKHKIEIKTYSKDEKLIEDLVGVKIMLYFVEDLDIVRELLEDMFKNPDWSESTYDTEKFAPAKVNVVFDIPDDMEVKGIDTWIDFLIDKRFEVQLKTVLFQSWHEIEHDFRYKNKDIWKGFPEMDRKFNSILATLELCDDSVINVLERIAYLNYKKAKENKHDAWYLERIIMTHFRLKLQNPRSIFNKFIKKDDDLRDKIDTALAGFDSETLFEVFLSKYVKKLSEEEIHFLARYFSSIVFLKRIIKIKRNSFVSRLVKYKNKLPVNIFTICLLVFLNDDLYSDGIIDILPEGVNQANIKKELNLFLKNESVIYEERKNYISKYKTYPTYQMKFDIYPSQNDEKKQDIDDVFKIVFNNVYIWLDEKIDRNSFDKVELSNYINFGQIFNGKKDGYEDRYEDRYELCISSEYDIRAIYVPMKKSAAFRIAELATDAKDGSSRKFDYHNRSFFSDIAISNCDDHVELSVKIECREPDRNIISAASFRPKFIRTMFMNTDLEFVEHGLSYDFRWIRQLSPDGKVTGGLPYVIDKDNISGVVEMLKNIFIKSGVDSNDGEVLPFIFVNSFSLNIITDINGVKGIDNEVKYLVRSLLGYAHIISYDDDIKDELISLFDYKNITESIENNRIFVLTNESYYKNVFDIGENPDFLKLSNEIKSNFINNMVGRNYAFGSTLFFRELKNAYYELVAGDLNDKQMQLIIGLSKENEELKIKYEQALETIKSLKEEAQKKV